MLLLPVKGVYIDAWPQTHLPSSNLQLMVPMAMLHDQL